MSRSIYCPARMWHPTLIDCVAAHYVGEQQPEVQLPVYADPPVDGKDYHNTATIEGEFSFTLRIGGDDDEA